MLGICDLKRVYMAHVSCYYSSNEIVRKVNICGNSITKIICSASLQLLYVIGSIDLNST